MEKLREILSDTGDFVVRMIRGITWKHLSIVVLAVILVYFFQGLMGDFNVNLSHILTRDVSSQVGDYESNIERIEYLDETYLETEAHLQEKQQAYHRLERQMGEWDLCIPSLLTLIESNAKYFDIDIEIAFDEKEDTRDYLMVPVSIEGDFHSTKEYLDFLDHNDFVRLSTLEMYQEEEDWVTTYIEIEALKEV